MYKTNVSPRNSYLVLPFHRILPHNIKRQQDQMASSSAKRSHKEAKKQRENAQQQHTKSLTRSRDNDKSSEKTSRRHSSPSSTKQQQNGIDDAASGGNESSSASDSSIETSDLSSDEETVARPKKIKRTNAVYYKVKLYSPGGKNPTKLMQQLLKSWFKAVKACSSTFVVYEYSNTAKNKVIQMKYDITSNIQFLKRLFSGLRLKKIPGDVWFTFLAGYDEQEGKFKDNTDWWYKDNNSGIFKPPIQAPDTVRNVWLL